MLNQAFLMLMLDPDQCAITASLPKIHSQKIVLHFLSSQVMAELMVPTVTESYPLWKQRLAMKRCLPLSTPRTTARLRFGKFGLNVDSGSSCQQDEKLQVHSTCLVDLFTFALYIERGFLT